MGKKFDSIFNSSNSHIYIVIFLLTIIQIYTNLAFEW